MLENHEELVFKKEDLCCTEFFDMWNNMTFQHSDRNGWYFFVSVDSDIEEDLVGFFLTEVPIYYCPFCGVKL